MLNKFISLPETPNWAAPSVTTFLILVEGMYRPSLHVGTFLWLKKASTQPLSPPLGRALRVGSRWRGGGSWGGGSWGASGSPPSGGVGEGSSGRARGWRRRGWARGGSHRVRIKVDQGRIKFALRWRVSSVKNGIRLHAGASVPLKTDVLPILLFQYFFCLGKAGAALLFHYFFSTLMEMWFRAL